MKINISKNYYAIPLLIIPGLPAAIISNWLLDNVFRRKTPACGGLEEFVAMTMVWAAIFWIGLIVFLVSNSGV